MVGAGPEEPEPSRILIADDHPLYRDALKQMLSDASDLVVVGEATDGREALELCRRLRPDLVLMDVRMPNMDGLEATRAIKAEFPLAVVLILTSFEDPRYLSEAIRAGAGGYVLKVCCRRQILNSVRRVLRGESPLDQELAMELLKPLLADRQEQESEGHAKVESSERPLLEEPAVHPLLKKLTQRELEVLRMVSAGKSNRQIAHELVISLSTVKTHVEHLMAKLEVSDRMQAAVLALKLGLFDEADHRAE